MSHPTLLDPAKRAALRTLGEFPTLWQGMGAATIVSGVLLTRVPASESS